MYPAVLETISALFGIISALFLALTKGKDWFLRQQFAIQLGRKDTTLCPCMWPFGWQSSPP
ncbi:MAG: hypothetical protein ACE5JB_16435 [bacterium]